MALKKPQKSLKKWTKQKWTTKSGKPSTQGPKATGERYLPKSAIKSLTAKEYAATCTLKTTPSAVLSPYFFIMSSAVISSKLDSTPLSKP